MDEELLLNELQDLNLICAECEYRYDVYNCHSCHIFRRIVYIHHTLEELEN